MNDGVAHAADRIYRVQQEDWMPGSKNVGVRLSLLAIGVAVGVSAAPPSWALPIVHFSTSTIANGGCSGGSPTTDVNVSIDPNGFVLSAFLLTFAVVPAEINLVSLVGAAGISASGTPGGSAFSFGAAFATNQTATFALGTITVQGCIGGGMMTLASQTYTDDNFVDSIVNTPVGAAIVVGTTPPTASPTTPEATNTPIRTATPLATPCVGDCDGSGSVTVDELITMVDIALGNSPLSACPIGDADGSGGITVDEIIKAVGFALTSCPGT